MDRRINDLWIRALSGSSEAYRKLGIIFLQGKLCRKDRRLAGLCLLKAAKMGDDKGYWLYHREFSKGREVIDDYSYKEMYRDYKKAWNPAEKKKLRKYLRLGTIRQKACVFLYSNIKILQL